jgi:hypothetical protein
MIGLNLDACRTGLCKCLRHNGSDLSSQTVVARLSLTDHSRTQKEVYVVRPPRDGLIVWLMASRPDQCCRCTVHVETRYT